MNKSCPCYCGSEIDFQDCCEKYINGIQKAPTALALMKSRYAAYATHQVDYLWYTTHFSERKHFSKAEILNWASTNEWKKLEIISFTHNTVEFRAHFIDCNQHEQIHYEFSTFLEEKEGWYYMNGKFD